MALRSLLRNSSLPWPENIESAFAPMLKVIVTKFPLRCTAAHCGKGMGRCNGGAMGRATTSQHVSGVDGRCCPSRLRQLCRTTVSRINSINLKAHAHRRKLGQRNDPSFAFQIHWGYNDCTKNPCTCGLPGPTHANNLQSYSRNQEPANAKSTKRRHDIVHE